MSEERCPYCLAALRGPQRLAIVSCTLCLTRHHRACYREHGRCVAFGCQGEETTSDVVAERRPGWDLHPFIPVEGEVSRPPFFLSVHSRSEPGLDQRRKPSFKLNLPERARCGRPLEGQLEAFVPRAVHGHGLRLAIEAGVYRDDDEDQRIYQEEAVLQGRPRRGWLEKLKLWKRAPEPLLLPGGVSRYQFSFDPGRLHWEHRLPRDERFGYWHTLQVRAVLDARALSHETRTHRVLVTHGHRRCGDWVRPEPG